MSDPTATPLPAPAPAPLVDPPAPPVVVLPTVPVTPGASTTEYKVMLVVGIIAAVFGGLMTSGVLGGASVVERVVGILSILVTPFGYTISRTAVKVSAARAVAAVAARGPLVLLVVLIGATSLTTSAGCWSSAQPRVAAGADALLDCESDAIRGLLAEVLPFARKWVGDLLSGTSSDPLADLIAAAAPIKSDLGRCALVAAVAAATADAANKPATAGLTVDPAAARRADLRHAMLRARVQLGWQPIMTASGAF